MSNPLAPERESLTNQAARKRRRAVGLARWADVAPETPEESESRAESLTMAAELHDETDGLLRLTAPPRIEGGEVVECSGASPVLDGIADRLANPSRINVDASIARTSLLVNVQSDVLALGVDAAQSIGARNSLEKMLAHQLALLHSVGMRIMDKALMAKEGDRVGYLNSATRMMDVFQRGILTVQRLRTGGAQTVEVRHVTVEAGGKAVIGNVRTGGRPRPKRRSGSKRK